MPKFNLTSLGRVMWHDKFSLFLYIRVAMCYIRIYAIQLERPFIGCVIVAMEWCIHVCSINIATHGTNFHGPYYKGHSCSNGRHMEALYALLTICDGNPMVSNMEVWCFSVVSFNKLIDNLIVHVASLQWMKYEMVCSSFRKHIFECVGRKFCYAQNSR